MPPDSTLHPKWWCSPVADPQTNTLRVQSSVNSPSHPHSAARCAQSLVWLLALIWWSVLLGRGLLRAIVIHGVLTLWPFQLDRNLRLRLLNVIVFSEGLKSRGQHLHPQHAIRNAVKTRLPFRVSLQFHVPAFLLALRIHGMHDHRSISDRLPVIVLDDLEIQKRGRFVLIFLPERRARHRKHNQEYAGRNDLLHASHSIQTRFACHLVSSWMSLDLLRSFTMPR